MDVLMEAAVAEDRPQPEPALQVQRDDLQWQQRRSGSELMRVRGAYRNPYARDRARVMHSQSYRQLQGKHLLGGVDDGEVFRTRATLAQEAAQLSRGLLRSLQHLHSASAPWARLLPEPNLIEAIAFGRQMGCPAFGEAGETALNNWLHDSGGFSAPAQTLRLLARQEPYADQFGLDLSRRVLLGCLAHPAPRRLVFSASSAGRDDRRRPPGCYYDADQDIVDWTLLPASSSDSHAFMLPSALPRDGHHGAAGWSGFDASLIGLAEALATGVHVLEDGIRLGLVTAERWLRLKPDPGWAAAVELGSPSEAARALFGASESARRRAIGTLVNAFIVSVEVDERDDIEEPLLRHRVCLLTEAEAFLAQLRHLVHEVALGAPAVSAYQRRGGRMLRAVAEAFWDDPLHLLPEAQRQAHEQAGSTGEQRRLLADWLASACDARVMRWHTQLVGPVSG
ncbi:dGTP triphosphohydrolase [Roseateles sp. BYS87W]|uniref:dGTP triphosphohydrolase n=1 Tax=Pelomonas baiyunensis TaxID=3299026 RepID=A0ABW7GZ89_9BURK